MTMTSYIKTDNKWDEIQTRTESIDEEKYNKIIKTTDYFRNRGWLELKCYKYKGYPVLETNSICPNRKNKIRREFIF